VRFFFVLLLAMNAVADVAYADDCEPGWRVDLSGANVVCTATVISVRDDSLYLPMMPQIDAPFHKIPLTKCQIAALRVLESWKGPPRDSLFVVRNHEHRPVSLTIGDSLFVIGREDLGYFCLRSQMTVIRRCETVPFVGASKWRAAMRKNAHRRWLTTQGISAGS
jgi:hypothetical protein